MSQKKPGEVDNLLKNWEESYKKGLLSFWLLLILYEEPSYAYELGRRVNLISQGTITADEKSIYRALTRFQSIGIVKSELLQSQIGPKRRYYSLTQIGRSLLFKFIRRNILVFETPLINERIHTVMKNEMSSQLLEVDNAISQSSEYGQVFGKNLIT